MQHERPAFAAAAADMSASRSSSRKIAPSLCLRQVETGVPSKKASACRKKARIDTFLQKFPAGDYGHKHIDGRDARLSGKNSRQRLR